MALQNNPVLGSIQCPTCNQSATVHKTTRGKGRFLYSRCMECGPDQRTGKAVQRRLWEQTDWRDGMKPESAPPNLELDDWKPGRPPPGAEAKPQPEQPKKAQPEAEKPQPEQAKPEAKTKRKNRLLPGLIGLLLVGGTGALAIAKTRANTGGERL